MFKYRGVITVNKNSISEEIIIESGADDYQEGETETQLIVLKENFSGVLNYLQEKSITVLSSGFEYLPSLEAEITDFEQ